MPREPLILNTWVIALAAEIDSRGLDARSLVREAGLPEGVLLDTGGRHPISGLGRLFAIAIERTGDPCIGLHAAQFVQPTTYHGLGLAILASDTLEDAMRRGARYARLIADAIDLDIAETESGLRQNLRVRTGAPLIPAAIDLYMVGSLRMGRLLTGTDDRPLKIWRTHTPPPAVVAEHARIFDTEIEFGADVNGYVLDLATARRPLPMANPALAFANDEAVRSYLAAFDGARCSDRVREIVIARFSAGEPSRQVVARTLGLGEKTLQRRLADEGTTFNALVDDARLELAQRYLADAELSLAEIAFRLGFAEQSGFARAFRRWTGSTPIAYRQARHASRR
jgi:AraC-like DNA-binding protein